MSNFLPSFTLVASGDIPFGRTSGLTTTEMMASADNVRVAEGGREGGCGMDAAGGGGYCLSGNLAYFAPSKSIMGLLSNVQRARGDTLS